MKLPKISSDKALSSLSLNPILVLVFTFAVFFGSQIIASLFVGIYPALKGWSETQTNSWFNISVSAQFFLVLIVESLVILAVYLFLRKLKVGLKSIGLSRPKIKNLWQAVGGFLIYFLILIVVLQFVTWLFPGLNIDQKQQIGFEDARSTGQLILVGISLVVLPPLAEEIIVRGFLYQGLKSSLPKWISVIVTSALFALAHLQFGSGAPLLWTAGIDTFLLSITLIYLFEKTGSLWAGIFLHVIKNGLAFVSLFLLK